MAKCWAYNEDGSICEREATGFDLIRGYPVCDRHAAQRRSVRDLTLNLRVFLKDEGGNKMEDKDDGISADV